MSATARAVWSRTGWWSASITRQYSVSPGTTVRPLFTFCAFERDLHACDTVRKRIYQHNTSAHTHARCQASQDTLL